MELLRQITRQLDSWGSLLSWCLNAPWAAPACKPLWTWTTIAAAVVGLLVLWKLLAWLTRPLRVWLEERRLRARDSEVADRATMARYRIDDSKLHSGTAPENVEQKIREALLEKKLADQGERHHQRTGGNKPQGS